jgi:hypothetical protein
VLRRASQRPAACNQPTPNTPVSNFDVFARTWAEQYGFFDLKHVDWSAVVAANRPKVSDTTTAAVLFAVLRGMIVDRYLVGGLHKYCEGQLEFGMLAPDIGYLRIRSFSRYSPDVSFDSGLVALEAALDTIFASAKAWTGLVTDVRINGGGADPYGLAIASRLTAKDYVAYGKSYDGPGIPPTIDVPVFASADRESGRDRAIEKALEVLRRR